MKKLFLLTTLIMTLFLTSCNFFNSKTSTIYITTVLESTTTQHEQSTTTNNYETTTTNQVTTTEQITTTTSQNISYNDLIKVQLETLSTSYSYELRYQLFVQTDEFDLSINPLFTMKKYTDEFDQIVYRIHDFNHMLLAIGLEPLDIIIDERVETIYLNSTQDWYQGSFTEIETLAGIPIFEYLFNLKNTPEDEITVEIEYFQRLFLESIVNFSKVKYIEDIYDNDTTLKHFELKYNVFNLLTDIFEHFKEKELDQGINQFLSSYNLLGIIDLFKTFTIDLYLEEDSLTICRIDIELMEILDNDLFIDFIESYIDHINIKKIMDYIKYFEISIIIKHLNTLDEIIVPNEALNGLPINELIP